MHIIPSVNSIVLCLVWMFVSGGNTAVAQGKSGVAYEVTSDIGQSMPRHLYYDRGKYTIVSVNEIRIYNGVNPLIKWTLTPATKKAQLDGEYKTWVLFDMIQKHGIMPITRKSGIDLPVLTKFARLYRPYKPRNFDHLLGIVAPSSESFKAEYCQLGKGEVARWRCDIYDSKKYPNHKIWVEPSSGCILKWSDFTLPADPRLPPYRSGDYVSSFRPVRSIPALRFVVPPGYTTTLPRILQDFSLPGGMKRRLMSGKDSYLGFDLKQYVDNLDKTLKEQANYQEAYARWLKAHKK